MINDMNPQNLITEQFDHFDENDEAFITKYSVDSEQDDDITFQVWRVKTMHLLAATAALEVQMLVCLSVSLLVCCTCYNCT